MGPVSVIIVALTLWPKVPQYDYNHLRQLQK